MRRTVAAPLSIALVLALSGPASSATVPATEACQRPRCFDVAVPHAPSVKVPDNRVRIVLPAGYRSHGPGYPVLYLLHGVGDTYAKWSENTDLVGFTRRFRVIVVMPDAGHGSDAGWYSDWKDDSRDWESFHIDTLIPWVDARFNTLGDGHRAVAGFSMGGFGAMSYAARHPGLFAAAATFSGAVDTQYVAPLSGVAFGAFGDRLGTPDDRVWGDQTADSATWSAHNPTALAPNLACTQLWIATGNGAPGGPAGDDPSKGQQYPIEHFIWQMNLSFMRALDDAGVDYHEDLYGGGYHGWPYWQMDLHRTLPGIVKVIRKGAAQEPCLARIKPLAA
ncbi:MAG: alpha/beta hydrolase [Actinomycetota bacterium]